MCGQSGAQVVAHVPIGFRNRGRDADNIRSPFGLRLCLPTLGTIVHL